jgi:hypothetical protein
VQGLKRFERTAIPWLLSSSRESRPKQRKHCLRQPHTLVLTLGLFGCPLGKVPEFDQVKFCTLSARFDCSWKDRWFKGPGSNMAAGFLHAYYLLCKVSFAESLRTGYTAAS